MGTTLVWEDILRVIPSRFRATFNLQFVATDNASGTEVLSIVCDPGNGPVEQVGDRIIGHVARSLGSAECVEHLLDESSGIYRATWRVQISESKTAFGLQTNDVAWRKLLVRGAVRVEEESVSYVTWVASEDRDPSEFDHVVRVALATTPSP